MGEEPKVGEAWPVTRVLLTDREQYYRHISGGYRAPSWLSGIAPDYVTSDRYQRAFLPESLHAIVHSLDESHICGDNYECFEDEETAYEALSYAAVNYGRRLAGLPELEIK
jgi:hypothetical protein